MTSRQKGIPPVFLTTVQTIGVRKGTSAGSEVLIVAVASSARGRLRIRPPYSADSRCVRFWAACARRLGAVAIAASSVSAMTTRHVRNQSSSSAASSS